MADVRRLAMPDADTFPVENALIPHGTGWPRPVGAWKR